MGIWRENALKKKLMTDTVVHAHLLEHLRAPEESILHVIHHPRMPRRWLCCCLITENRTNDHTSESEKPVNVCKKATPHE
jgi:hypothetical protein